MVVLNLPDSMTRHVKSAVREGLAPLQAALSSTSRKTRESLEAIRGIGGLVKENEKMSGELVRLRNELRQREALEKENIALRQQLAFARRTTRDVIPCEVIARDISGWWQTVRLGKGRADGVEVNMAVVTSDGLVGKTVAVSPRTADVLLLSDPGCKVSAQITRTGAFGIVSGRGTSWKGQASCEIEFVNKNTSTRAGDEVVTSGLGGVFPKGLLIGYIDHVDMDKSGLYQVAQVVPRADLGGLDYIFVVAERSDPVEELLRTKGLTGASRP